jgi:hypothetical protein
MWKMKLTSIIAHYWYNKLKGKRNIDFPEKLCDAIAGITDDFSFAYMKEAFVATLLELARGGDDSDSDGEADDSAGQGGDEDDDPLDEYQFWRVFKAQVKILRSEMGDGSNSQSEAAEGNVGAYGSTSRCDDMVPLLDAIGLQDIGRQPGDAALPLAPPPRVGGMGRTGEGRSVDYADLFAAGMGTSPYRGW